MRERGARCSSGSRHRRRGRARRWRPCSCHGSASSPRSRCTGLWRPGSPRSAARCTAEGQGGRALAWVRAFGLPFWRAPGMRRCSAPLGRGRPPGIACHWCCRPLAHPTCSHVLVALFRRKPGKQPSGMQRPPSSMQFSQCATWHCTRGTGGRGGCCAAALRQHGCRCMCAGAVAVPRPPGRLLVALFCCAPARSRPPVSACNRTRTRRTCQGPRTGSSSRFRTAGAMVAPGRGHSVSVAVAGWARTGSSQRSGLACARARHGGRASRWWAAPRCCAMPGSRGGGRALPLF